MSKRLSPFRVVLVDDDQDDIFLTKAFLRHASVPIDFKGFHSGAALFDFIKNNGLRSIDLLLLDINMPLENGYDVLKKLQAYPAFDEVVVVMYSTIEYPNDELATTLGANGFIKKPIRSENLNQILETLPTRYYDLYPLLRAA